MEVGAENTSRVQQSERGCDGLVMLSSSLILKVSSLNYTAFIFHSDVISCVLCGPH